jgi:hypothetical protein
MGVDDYMMDDPYEHVLTNYQVIKLAEALQENKDINAIDLTAHFIEPSGVTALAQVASITNLSVASNRLCETDKNHDEYMEMVDELVENNHIN